MTVQPANAIPVFDATNLAQNIKSWIVENYQLAKDTITASQGTITATQQTIETVNNKILIPMRDAAAILALMESGKYIENLILGSMGTQPLLIDNPGKYFKDRALSSTGVDLSILSRNTGFYDSSVLASLINTNRYNYADASTKLKAINRSSIPKTVQKQVCEDASLSQLAQEDVLASSDDGTIDEVALGDRKRELYRALCSGDPDTNPALATTLMKLGEQRPDLGGWDAWLARTSGDNAYNKTVQSQLVIATKAQEAIDLAKLDYTIGGGLKSLTECKTYAENDLNGNLYGETSTPGCAVEEIKQVSSVLNSIYVEAMNAPTKLLQSAIGPGAGNLINEAFRSIHLIRGITGAVDSMTGSGTTNRNAAAISPNTSTPVKDLANNPKAKETLSSPPKQHLLYHQNALDSLEKTNKDHSVYIGVYQNKLENTKMCFDKLIVDYPQTEGDSRVRSALDFYQTKTESNNALNSRLQQELSLVGTTKTLVSDTITSINNSQSSEEILSLFKNYQNRIDSERLPDLTAGATREGEYITFKMEVDGSTTDGGPLHTYNNDCASIRQQLDAMNFSGAGA